MTPQTRTQQLLELKFWRRGAIAEFMHLPLYLIEQAADFPPPDMLGIHCGRYDHGACEDEEGNPYCDEKCHYPMWKPETVKAWAERRGLAFAPIPVPRWL